MTKIISNEEAQEQAKKIVRVQIEFKTGNGINYESFFSVHDTNQWVYQAMRMGKSLLSFKNGAVWSDEIKAFQVYERPEKY